MTIFRNKGTGVVVDVDDDTGARLVGAGWVPADAVELVDGDSVKRKPGRPKKEASDGASD